MKICSPICMVTGLQDSNCWGLEGLEYLDVSISMWCVHLAFLAWRLQDSWNSYTMDLCSKVSLPRETQIQTERQNLSTSSNLASEVTYVTSTVFYLLGQPEMPAKTQGENTLHSVSLMRRFWKNMWDQNYCCGHVGRI